MRKSIRLQPTFPLDGDAIRLKKFQRIFKSPITLGTLCAAGLATFVLKMGWMVSTGVLGGAAAALVGYWRTKNSELDAEIIRELVQQSNDEQDQQLQAMMDQLQTDGHDQYAASLGKFLLLKQHIEQELHSDGALDDKKCNIEQLVDSLCDGVCAEIERLGKLDQKVSQVLTSRNPKLLASLTKEQQVRHHRIMKAYAVMYETAEQLVMLLNPGVKPTDPLAEEARVLDRLIEQLREENRITKEVHDSLRKDVESIDTLQR